MPAVCFETFRCVICKPAIDMSVDVQTAAESKVALDLRALADQRVQAQCTSQ